MILLRCSSTDGGALLRRSGPTSGWHSTACRCRSCRRSPPFTAISLFPTPRSRRPLPLGALPGTSRTDPYRLLAFTSWRVADAVARRLGIAENDDRRLVGAVEATLGSRLERNHTWISEAALAAGTTALLRGSRETAVNAIRLAARCRAIVTHGTGYQAPGPYIMERFVEGRCMDTGNRAIRSQPAC